MPPSIQLLILDACVLVDFCKTDISLLTLISQHVGPVHVASPVLDEVEQLDSSSAASAGITVVEPPLEIALVAAAKRGALSFQDWLCLLMAKENSWTCVSNDGRLRKECAAEGVAVIWGFDALAMLVAKGALTIEGAEAAARAIQATNRRYVTDAIVARFVKKLRKG